MSAKGKNRINTIFALAFALFLGMSVVMTVLREDETYSYYENRNLAAFPAISAEGVANGSYFSDLETYASDHAPGRRIALYLKTFLETYILQRPVVNDTVILRGEGVLLDYNEPDTLSGTLNSDGISYCAGEIARRLQSHARQVEAYGGTFLYAAVPCQYVCYEDAYPSWLNNRHAYTEASANALFSALTDANVPYIDMREIYAAEGTLQSNSSVVDNHYSIFGAFRLYEALIERLNRDGGYGLETPRLSDFTAAAIPNPYMGSRVRKLCGLWRTTEQLWTLTPVTPVPFTRQDNGNPSQSTVYALPYNTWDPVLYGVYMGGDIAHTQIQTNRPSLPSILLYGDSFTNALECVVWYSFDTMTSYDFRHYTEKTLEEIIAAEKPDVVLCVRDYQAILNLTANGQ